MERNNPAQPNFLLIRVILSSPDKKSLMPRHGGSGAIKSSSTLRGYLAGSSFAVRIIDQQSQGA